MQQSDSIDDAELNRLRRNIYLVLAVRILAVTTSGLSVPILAIYVGRGKVSDAEFFMLQALFHLTAVCFDAPFGYLADRWGRRHFIRWGGGMLVVGALCYAASASFLGFLAAEMCFAVGQAAIFGAEQALLRDTLERLKQPEEFHRIWGRALSIEMAATAGTTLLSGFLFAWKPSSPFLIEAGLFSLLMVLACFLHEPGERTVSRVSFAGGFIEGVRVCLLESAWLRWMFVASAVWASILIGTLWCQSKLLIGHGVKESSLGFWFASMNLLSGGLGMYLSKRRCQAASAYRVCTLIVIMLAGAMFLLTAPPGNSGLFLVGVGIGLTQVVRAVSRIRMAEWIKDALPSAYHATGVSFATMANRLGFVVLAILVYPFLDAWSPTQKFIVLGAFSVLSGALLLVSFPRRDKAFAEKS